MSGPKYFQIGFNRCGTTSLADYFRRGGLRVADCKIDSGEFAGEYIALVMKRNTESALPLFSGLEEFDCVTDAEYVSEHEIEEGFKRFDIALAQYPQMKFILNVRDIDDWVKSRLGFGSYAETYAKFHDIDASEVVALWRNEWKSHFSRVLDIVPPGRLLVLDIEKPDMAALSHFCGIDVSINFRKRNMMPTGKISSMLASRTPTWVRQIVPNDLKNALKKY